MARIPTYILAPNFNLTDTPQSPYYPWLGNIIADPLNPTTRILSRLSDGPPASAVSVAEDENTYVRGSGKSINSSLWSCFLQFVSGSVDLEKAREGNVKYSMGGVETRYYEPSDEEIEERVRGKGGGKVRAAMNAGLWGRQPVYVVNGVKIAKGFSMERCSESQISGGVGLGATVTPDGSVSAGVDVGGSKRRVEETSFKTADEMDIVFAYQVHPSKDDDDYDTEKMNDTWRWLRFRHHYPNSSTAVSIASSNGDSRLGGALPDRWNGTLVPSVYKPERTDSTSRNCEIAGDLTFLLGLVAFCHGTNKDAISTINMWFPPSKGRKDR